MRKLTLHEAGGVLFSAVEDRVGKQDTLRLGQAIWNNLPDDILEEATGTGIDFFYEENGYKATQMFLEHFVEGEGK
jgi:hypothetical protein